MPFPLLLTPVYECLVVYILLETRRSGFECYSIWKTANVSLLMQPCILLSGVMNQLTFDITMVDIYVKASWLAFLIVD